MRFSEFTEDEVLRVREKIEQVLCEIGMRVEMPKVREMCAAAGAKVEGDRVYFPPEVLSHFQIKEVEGIQQVLDTALLKAE